MWPFKKKQKEANSKFYPCYECVKCGYICPIMPDMCMMVKMFETVGGEIYKRCCPECGAIDRPNKISAKFYMYSPFMSPAVYLENPVKADA